MTETCTTCPYCGVGCGVIVSDGPEGFSVRGDPDHPANKGALCSKGSALAETLIKDERLYHPTQAGRRVSWDDALQSVADKFSQVVQDHGPEAVAFYVSGQLLTEDYYVANKLMKGFIGAANIDTNSRLCMASSVAGHKRAFGSDTVPGNYEDFELADLVVLTGSNLGWCHPVLYQRLVVAKAARPEMKIVVIDPRRTATCDIADLHLMLEPGSDVALFMGLLNALNEGGVADPAWLADHTSGSVEALAAAKQWTLDRTSLETGLSHDDLAIFFRWACETDRQVTVYSQGVNQAADGTDRVNAIINCHLLTGRIGKPGAGPFSVTGQPNAMGGREVGGLANQLASHMEIANADDRDRVQRFWNSPRMADKPGLKAVDLFDAIEAGDVKAVWIMATNPVVSMPDADRVKEALKKCELVVVSDISSSSDTAQCADILLPSTGWGEKAGMVTNSERRMSRQRSFMAAPGEAKHDWWQICEVASRMGFADAFDYAGPAEIFAEYAALCGFENEGSRDLDLGPLATLSAADYEDFRPRMWPLDQTGEPTERLFADGKFFTQDGKARFIAPENRKGPREDGYVLNTGRIRDHWHTMTRTGLTPRLARHIAEPFIEIAEGDARRLGLKDADIAELSSPRGKALARVLITDRQQPGSIFAPMHWTDAYASNGRIDVLVESKTDPHSGQPALKSSRVQVRPFSADWYGFIAIETDQWDLTPDCRYWAKARTENGLRFELAGFAREGDFASVVDALVTDNSLSWVSVQGGGVVRRAAYRGNRLVLVAVAGQRPVEASRSYICDLIGTEPEDRGAVLAGRSGVGGFDKGPIVCSCMNVGANDIAKAVAEGASCAETIGQATGAGTNCGSCRSEFPRFLEPVLLAAE